MYQSKIVSGSRQHRGKLIYLGIRGGKKLGNRAHRKGRVKKGRNGNPCGSLGEGELEKKKQERRKQRRKGDQQTPTFFRAGTLKTSQNEKEE